MERQMSTPSPLEKDLDEVIVKAFQNNMMITMSGAMSDYLINTASTQPDIEWMTSMNNALRGLAVYLSNLQTSQDEVGLLDLFRRDRERTLRAALNAVSNLLSHSHPYRNAVSRFGMAKEIGVSENLDTLMHEEIARCAPDNQPQSEHIRDLGTFRKEAALIFHAPIAKGFESLLQYPKVLIGYALTESVRFVEATADFYHNHDDFPGDDFRSLLLAINIHLISSASADPDLAHLQPPRVDLKKLSLLRKQPGRPPGYMPELYSKPKTASEVLLTPGTVYKDLVLKAPDLLAVVRYLAALKSFERRGVFCPGFFSTTCVILLECTTGRIHPMPIVSVQRKMISSIVEGEEDTDSSDDEDKDTINVSEYKGVAVDRLMVTSGGFFGDTSSFGEEMRKLIMKGQFEDVQTFANDILDNDRASLTVRQLVSSLIDLVNRMWEQEMHHRMQLQGQKQQQQQTAAIELDYDVIRDLPNVDCDRYRLARLYVNQHPQHAMDHLIQSIGPSSFQPAKDAEISTLLVNLFDGNTVSKYVNKLFELIAKGLLEAIRLVEEKFPKFISTFSPFGKDSPFGKIAILTEIEEGVNKVLLPKPGVNDAREGLKWASIMENVDSTPEFRELVNNSATLHTTDQQGRYTVLETMIEGNPPSLSYEDDDDGLTAFVSLASGLLHVVEMCTMLTPLSPYFNGCSPLRPSTSNEEKELWVLTIDVDILSKTVDCIVNRLQRITAMTVGSVRELRPHLLVAACRNEIPFGSLSKPPSTVSKALVSSFSRKYLSYMLPTRDQKIDNALITAVAKNGSDLVRGQVLLIVIAAISLVVNLKQRGPKSRGVARNITYLCILTSLRSVFDMTRLSNPHFFSVLEKLNENVGSIATATATATAAVSESKRQESELGKWSISGNLAMRKMVLGGALPNETKTTDSLEWLNSLNG